MANGLNGFNPFRGNPSRKATPQGVIRPTTAEALKWYGYCSQRWPAIAKAMGQGPKTWQEVPAEVCAAFMAILNTAVNEARDNIGTTAVPGLTGPTPKAAQLRVDEAGDLLGAQAFAPEEIFETGERYYQLMRQSARDGASWPESTANGGSSIPGLPFGAVIVAIIALMRAEAAKAQALKGPAVTP